MKLYIRVQLSKECLLKGVKCLLGQLLRTKVHLTGSLIIYKELFARPNNLPLIKFEDCYCQDRYYQSVYNFVNSFQINYGIHRSNEGLHTC